MADMRKEFEKLGGEAAVAFAQFFSFFTVKRVVTLLIVVLALFLVCAPRDVTAPVAGQPVECDSACPLPGTAGPPIHTENMAQENWSFTLIGNGWSPRELPTSEIKLALENRNVACMVFVVKEQTNDSFGAYVVSTIRGFAESGTTVDSVKVVDLNKQKFVLAQVNHDDEVVWLWVTVKNGFGYGFTCGCDINPRAGAAQRDLCQYMADTFVIE